MDCVTCCPHFHDSWLHPPSMSLVRDVDDVTAPAPLRALAEPSSSPRHATPARHGPSPESE